MPTYDYRCVKCGYESELYASFDDYDKPINLYAEEEGGCECEMHRLDKVYATEFYFNEDRSKIKNMPTKKGGERALRKHMEEVNRIMNEPISPSEVQAGKEMMATREKEKGLPPGAISGDRPTEMVEVATESGARIDRLALAQQIDESTGYRYEVGQVARMAEEKISETVGETVSVERTVRRGTEDLKKRAKRQIRDRGVRV